jgi:hypothetical protein
VQTRQSDEGLCHRPRRSGLNGWEALIPPKREESGSPYWKFQVLQITTGGSSGNRVGE